MRGQITTFLTLVVVVMMLSSGLAGAVPILLEYNTRAGLGFEPNYEATIIEAAKDFETINDESLSKQEVMLTAVIANENMISPTKLSVKGQLGDLDIATESDTIESGMMTILQGQLDAGKNYKIVLSSLADGTTFRWEAKESN